MKLYTEEQVNQIIDRAYDLELGTDEQMTGYLMMNITPIELPSDEEIEKEAWKCFPFPLNKDGEPIPQPVGHNPHGSKKFIKAFIKGYKAALKQILNQNK
jgi:hypothetical protein